MKTAWKIKKERTKSEQQRNKLFYSRATVCIWFPFGSDRCWHMWDARQFLFFRFFISFVFVLVFFMVACFITDLFGCGHRAAASQRAQPFILFIFNMLFAVCCASNAPYVLWCCSVCTHWLCFFNFRHWSRPYFRLHEYVCVRCIFFRFSISLSLSHLCSDRAYSHFMSMLLLISLLITLLAIRWLY